MFAMGTNPTTAAGWIEKCNQDYLTCLRVEGRSNGHLRHGWCLNCVTAYARQQAESLETEVRRLREEVVKADIIEQVAECVPVSIEPAPCEGKIEIEKIQSAVDKVSPKRIFKKKR